MAELAADLVAGYTFLADLDADERQVATLDGADRTQVLRMLEQVSGGRLADSTCW